MCQPGLDGPCLKVGLTLNAAIPGNTQAYILEKLTGSIRHYY